MTNIGKELVNEFVNETCEKIEDDKGRIFIQQGTSSIKNLTKYLIMGVQQTLTLLLVLSVVIFLITVDEADISQFREMGDADWVSWFKAYWTLIGIFMAFTLSLTVTIMAPRIVGSKMKDRLYAEQQEANLIRRMVEVQEELLIRHKLIKGEE